MTRTIAFTLTTLLLATTAPLAQAPGAGAPQAASAAKGAPAPVAEAAPKSEGAAQQGFTYDAAGRRDPFVSLLRRGEETQARSRASGLTGLSTAEVSLRGVLQSRGAYVGILQGVDSKTYIVRAGDRLADGTIRNISADEMVILQQVNDPLSIEKQREVRKMLRQLEAK